MEKRTIGEVKANMRPLAQNMEAKGLKPDEIRQKLNRYVELEGYTVADVKAHQSPVNTGRAAPTQTDSALRGAVQGASLGFADEAIGAFGAMTGQGDYEDIRDSQRQQNKTAQEANPKTFLGAEVAGGVAPALAAPAVKLTTLPNAGPTLGQVAKEGAVYGGAVGLGSAEGGALEQAGQAVTGTIFGGFGGMALQNISKLVGADKAAEATTRVVSRVFESITGRKAGGAILRELVDESGQITPQGMKAIENFESKNGDLNKLLQTELSAFQKEGGFVPTKEQAERFNQLAGEGLEPTLAQVTQNADDFIIQQELAKANPLVRNRLDNQNRALQDGLEDKAKVTGGQAYNEFDASSSVFEAVLGRANKYDEGINQLYTQAREIAPGAKNVKFNALTAAIKENAHLNKPANGAIDAVRELLETLGVADSKMTATGRTSVESAERVRQELNRIGQTNPLARGIAYDLKAKLDQDVMRSAGEDFFKQARSLKRQFHDEFDGGKLSKFDEKLKNPLRQIIDGSVEPDAVFKKFVKNGSERQLKVLVKALGKDEAGQVALKDMQAAWVREALEKSTRGGKTTLGDADLNASILDKEIKAALKSGKLQALFDAKQISGLVRLQKAAKLRQPVTGTALGKGPSGNAVGELTSLVEDVLSGGSMIAARSMSALKQKKANQRIARETDRILNPLKETKKKLDQFKRAGSPSIGIGASGANQTASSQFDFLN